MALIVENGTMPEGANSYASIADADAWQAARGSQTWPPADPDGQDGQEALKEAALILAADYLNGLKWVGRKAAPGRIMAWPRLEAFDLDGYSIAANAVPEAVKAACCYLAGLAYDGTDLQPILERGGRIQSRSVGKLSTSYFQDAPGRDVFSALADLLSGLAADFSAPGAISSPIIRA